MMFYTYTHSNLDGEVFYVGKGKGTRAYKRYDRGDTWKEYVDRLDGIIIRIVKRFNTDVEALAHEVKLVAHYKSIGVKLLNKTFGGLGVSGYIHTEEWKANMSKKLSGYKYSKIICPNCGKEGAGPPMKQHHFDNCIGLRPTYKARVTIAGVRISLGKFQTQKEADIKMINYYIEHKTPFSKEFIQRGNRAELIKDMI